MRIAILGRSGSGKTSYAIELGKRYAVPVHHLDKHFFKHSWIERDPKEFLEIQQNLVSQDRWIIDGNNLRTIQTRLARAHMLVIFDMPKLLCLWRVIKRAFQKNRNIDDRAPNSPERLTWTLIKYSWNYEKRLQKSADILENTSVPIVYVRSKADIRALDEKIAQLAQAIDLHQSPK